MTPEQRQYLADGLRYRSRFYAGHDRGEEYELTLALAWFRAYWKDQADRSGSRNLNPVAGDLFDEPQPSGLTAPRGA